MRFVCFVVVYADEQYVACVLLEGVGVAALFYLLQGGGCFIVPFQLDDQGRVVYGVARLRYKYEVSEASACRHLAHRSEIPFYRAEVGQRQDAAQ